MSRTLQQKQMRGLAVRHDAQPCSVELFAYATISGSTNPGVAGKLHQSEDWQL